MIKKPAKACIFFLLSPFVFFATSTLMVLGISFYLLSFPKELPKQIYSIFSSQPPILGATSYDFSSLDARPIILEQYFTHHQSPLAPYGKLLVSTADKYNLDWRLLPAIAMQESNGGKKIPDDSFNPFGYGIHSEGAVHFNSWEEGIEKVAYYLKSEYLDKGLSTPAEIMTVYTPLSLSRGGTWAVGVEYFMWEFANY